MLTFQDRLFLLKTWYLIFRKSLMDLNGEKKMGNKLDGAGKIMAKTIDKWSVCSANWSSLKTWLSDCAKTACFYESAKIYECVLEKMNSMEQGEKN